MSGKLQDKVAVVTGAASGIGLAATRDLLAEGARVVLVDRDVSALDRLADEFGERVTPQVTDLLNPEDSVGMVPSILAKTGRIDILLCNAGSYIGGNLVDTNPAAIDRMLNLNVNAVIKNVHAVAPHMIERGTGDILVTCSVAGHTAIDVEPVYSSSKWAVTCFVQIMRRQLMAHGIRVGQVSPGPAVTALLADWEPDRLEKLKAAGGLLDPAEISAAMMFMLTRPRNVTIRDMIVLPSNFDV